MGFEEKALISADVKTLQTHVLKLVIDSFNAFAVLSNEGIGGGAVGEHVILTADD